MGIRIEVIGVNGVADAMKILNRHLWLHDEAPEGLRLKWHKQRRDRYVKPSQLRHRRDASIARAKRFDSRYPSLDGVFDECARFSEF